MHLISVHYNLLVSYGLQDIGGRDIQKQEIREAVEFSGVKSVVFWFHVSIGTVSVIVHRAIEWALHLCQNCCILVSCSLEQYL